MIANCNYSNPEVVFIKFTTSTAQTGKIVFNPLLIVSSQVNFFCYLFSDVFTETEDYLCTLKGFSMMQQSVIFGPRTSQSVDSD